MNLPPSWALFALIVIGGAVAVVGNTLYPLAREQEKRAHLADDAWAILRPELVANKNLATEMTAGLETGTVDTRKFDVSAWETISKGGLLLGLKPADISKLLLVYKMCYRANETNAELNDYMAGLRSTLTKREQFLEFFRNSLKTTLVELQSAIGTIDFPK
jgi:hypothetical protein